MPTSRATTDHSGHRRRLRARYAATGLESFAPHEILELLLTYAIPRVNVNDQAHALLDRFGTLSGVLDATPEELMEVPGIGCEAALFLNLLPDVFGRYALDKCPTDEPFETVAQVADFMRATYTGVTEEQVYILLFDNGMRLLHCQRVGEGGINCVSANIPYMAQLAYGKHAASAVLVHNHPGGLAIPSSADLEITETLRQALELLGIPLLEHIIMTENSYRPIMRHRSSSPRLAPLEAGLEGGR